MANRSTNFEDDTSTLLFRGVCAIMQADSAMVSAKVKFQTWDGSKPDFGPPATGSMPLIRLSPKLMPNEPDRSETVTSVMRVVIECYAAGTNSDDVTNMWGAVQNAMVRNKPFNATQVVWQYLCEIGKTALYNPGGGAYRSYIDGPIITNFGSSENVPVAYQMAVGGLILKWLRPA